MGTVSVGEDKSKKENFVLNHWDLEVISFHTLTESGCNKYIIAYLYTDICWSGHLLNMPGLEVSAIFLFIKVYELIDWKSEEFR